MDSSNARTILIGVAVLFVAAGVLVGAAAADAHDDDDDEWTVAFEGDVDVADNGGEGGFTCTGMPTDHDCDKGGEFDAGPANAYYDGFNAGSLDGGEYAFNDTFVVTDEDGDGIVAIVHCELEDDAPEDNPCPTTVEEHEGDDRGSDRGDGGDGDGDPDASDDRRDNGSDDGNANDDENANEDREGDDDSDEPVDADADVTVDPPF